MLIRNSILRDRCKTAIDNSIIFLNDKKGDLDVRPVDIVSISGDAVSTSYGWVPNYRSFINKYNNKIKSLESVHSFITFVLNNEHLKNQILLSSGGSLDDVERIKSIIFSDLSTILEKCLMGVAFDRIYESYEAYLYSTEIEHSATALLENFEAEVNEIDFGEGLKIMKLSSQELTQIYNNAEFFWGPIPKQNVLRIKYKLERNYKIRKGERDQPKLQVQLFDNFISFLRLFKPGIIGYNSMFCRSNQWGGGGFIPHMGSHYINYFGAIGLPYKLISDELITLKKFWSDFKNYIVVNFKGLRLALQRFNYAYERQSSAEKILEYMIAFEAIYLTGVGGAELRGELRYRLSLKAANFLASVRSEKIKIFKDIMKAYGVRSMIVHGYEYPEDKIIKIDDKELNFSDFVSLVEEYLRQTVNKIISSRISKIDENVVFN